MARVNYIQNMKKQYGDNWINLLRPEDIQRSAKRVFKEMIRNQIDYEKDGNWFNEAKFLDNLIIAAQNELEINTLYYNAVTFYFQYYPDIPNISPQISHLEILCYVYNVILSKLSAVKVTGNIGCLFDTSSLLYSYRNHIV